MNTYTVLAFVLLFFSANTFLRRALQINGNTLRGSNSAYSRCFIFSSPGRSPGRAIVLPLVSALAKCLSFYVKVFYVMGKALSGKLSCPFDRSCCHHCQIHNLPPFEQILYE